MFRNNPVWSTRSVVSNSSGPADQMSDQGPDEQCRDGPVGHITPTDSLACQIQHPQCLLWPLWNCIAWDAYSRACAALLAHPGPSGVGTSCNSGSGLTVGGTAGAESAWGVGSKIGLTRGQHQGPYNVVLRVAFGPWAVLLTPLR